MSQQPLPPFSETVKLAWRLAAEEAVHAGLPQIEPPHLLLGIFGVERVIREEAWERYAVSPARLGLVRQEWNEVSSAFARASRRIPSRCPRIMWRNAPTRRVPFLIRRNSARGRWGTHW